MDQISKAVQLLNQGEVVGMPTETVYGLAAKIDSDVGLQKIFAVKARPFFDPLIVHVNSILQAQELAAEWPVAADLLAKKFWPGPLTLILKKSSKVSPLITSGLETVGLRWPSHPIAQDLIEKVGVALAAPSANKFGRTSPTTKQHVEDEFKNEVFVLEGGESEVGIESTIISIKDESEFSLLRPGMISLNKIQDYLNEHRIQNIWTQSASKQLVPGTMKHHYMPPKPLVLTNRMWPPHLLMDEIQKKISELPTEIEGVKIIRPTKIVQMHELHLPETPALAARGLYQSLREASGSSADVLILIWPEHKRGGEWSAIWDRLSKAASLDLI